MTSTNTRTVTEIIDAEHKLEGAGLPVRRAYPTHARMDVDPFLLLDHFGPVNWGPREGSGVPDHPHRGIETVTYILAGKLAHKDSRGHAAVLGPGDVQWMTAGAGIVHSEMLEEGFFNTGGTLHGFQIWVNLPAAEKMATPRYQDVPAKELPVAESGDGLARVRVVAGEALGQQGAVQTRIPITYLHWSLEPGARVTQQVPADHNAVAYVFGGTARVGEDDVQEGQAAILSHETGGDATSLTDIPFANRGEQAVELLFLAGPPLNEPVARYGPFVMNTQGEIRDAIRDYNEGRMGRIRPEIG